MFDAGVDSLIWLAHATGASYQEINIIVYFALIPIIWIIMIGMIYDLKPALVTIGFIAVGGSITLLGVDLIYSTSVKFEYWISILGWDYYEASVYTCIVFPFITTAILIKLLINKARRQ